MLNNKETLNEVTPLSDKDCFNNLSNFNRIFKRRPSCRNLSFGGIILQ